MSSDQRSSYVHVCQCRLDMFAAVCDCAVSLNLRGSQAACMPFIYAATGIMHMHARVLSLHCWSRRACICCLCMHYLAADNGCGSLCTWSNSGCLSRKSMYCYTYIWPLKCPLVSTTAMCNAAYATTNTTRNGHCKRLNLLNVRPNKAEIIRITALILTHGHLRYVVNMRRGLYWSRETAGTVKPNMPL